MALLDIFKKKEQEGKVEKTAKEPGVKKQAEVKVVEKKSVAPKQEAKANKSDYIKIEANAKKRVYEGASQILLSPHITEKATDLTAQNKYIFNVAARANKSEIKKAVEGIYGVTVVGVNVINTPDKKRIVRGRIGWKRGTKKAIVALKEGQKIEILPR